MAGSAAPDRSRLRIKHEGLTRGHWAGVALAAVTGLVHLVLGLGALPDPLGVAALLAAGGFAAGIVLLLAGYRRQWLLALGIPFTASQIAVWYLVNEPSSLGDVSPLAAFDKAVQTALIVVLFVLLWQHREGEK